MTTSIKTLLAAGTFTLGAIAPASADYTILQDSSLPSVLFVEFDDDEPKVISAPVMNIEPQESAAVSDPALPPIDDMDNTDGMDKADDMSVEERVEEKIKALEGASDVEMPAPVTMNETSIGDAPVDPILKPEPAPEMSDSDILSEAELR